MQPGLTARLFMIDNCVDSPHVLVLSFFLLLFGRVEPILQVLQCPALIRTSLTSLCQFLCNVTKRQRPSCMSLWYKRNKGLNHEEAHVCSNSVPTISFC